MNLLKITKREEEILKGLASGHTAKEIAAQHFISAHTVDSHRKNLIIKLKARNTPHLTALAVRMGVV